MLSDRSAPYPSSPARRKAALDDPLSTHEAMLLPPPSDGVGGLGLGLGLTPHDKVASDLGKRDDESQLMRGAAGRSVEPWGSLLLADRDREEEEDVQDRKFAEVVLGEGREEQERAILQDVARTRSGTPALRDEQVRQWLRRSVSLFCQERGLQYAQGLTELAAPWALITDPPCLGSFSYRCFCSFVDRFAPNMFATAPDAGGSKAGGARGRGRGAFVVIETHLVLLEQLLRFHDPALAAHLEKCCVLPAVYATPWFVTLFARQLPVPALLHLWWRLIEYGDPVLHQFLALAWLVNSHQALLETPREGVPKAALSLRLQSEREVDGVFAAAVALLAGTPRLVCRTLRRACYDGTMEHGKQTAAGGDASDARAPAGGGDEPAVTAEARVSLLEGLRAAGVLLVDADQVAEIFLARRSSPSPLPSLAAAPGGEEDYEEQYWRATRKRGGRFVLVDCRETTGPGSTAEGEVGDLEKEAAADGRVVWRRIPPAKSSGREAAAVAEILQELEAEARGVEAGDAEIGGSSSAPSKPVVNGEISSAVAAAAPHGASDTNGGAAAASPAGSYVGIHELNATAADAATTHVCFVGSGSSSSSSSSSPRNNGGGAGRRDFASAAAATAAEAEMPAPAFRLARAASRSCLAAHVCVLEGGFPALDKALLSRRGFRSGGEGGASAGVEAAGFVGSSSQVATRLGIGGETAARQGGGAVPAGATVAASSGGGGGGGGGGGVGQSAGPPRGELPSVSPGTDLRRASLALGGGGAPGGARFPQRVERRASRLAGNSRVSEPFRVYAAKSADEMGRALRSLPAAASKPLEDAARVCNSLARTNVRALGDSRLSLSRSITQLDQLNARMDGTASGFARYFGSSGRPKRGDGAS